LRVANIEMKPVVLQFSFIPLLFLVLLVLGCGKRDEVDLSAVPVDIIKQGVALMPTYCHTCHGVGDLEMDAMLAPPLWGVRAHYLARFSAPEDFVDAMTAFLVEPQAEQSLLPLEVAHYGLKAPVSLSEAELRAVGWAIYAGQVARPAWSREYRQRHRECEASW
jgi:mono/diheme cytochrome c family protein